MSAPQGERFLWLVPLGLAGVVLLLSGMLLAMGRHFRATERWEPVDARVLSVSRSVSTVRDARSGYMEQRPQTVTELSYEVRGARYAPTLTEAGHTRGVAGGTRRIWVDPAAPGRFVTKPEGTAGTVMQAVAAVLALIALPFVYLAIRWRPRRAA